MKHFISIYIYFILFTGIQLVSSCKDDILPEVTDLQTSRLFSPTDLEVRIVERTGVRLNWKAVQKATGYDIELYANGQSDFSGDPVRKIENISFDEVPYTITGLEGEMDYSARVRAIGEGITESTWITATFKTDPEQIFLPLDPEELLATQVTLHWPAGQVATSIVLTPGNLVHPLSSEEIAAGSATIQGLTSETDYTATLMNGEKTRGTLTFTTPLDLEGAIPVTPEDDLTALLAAANEGDVFALFPGEYPTQDLLITHSISIKAAKRTERPHLIGSVFRIQDGAGLVVQDLILDGTGAAGDNQAFIYDTDQTDPYGPLRIENCDISHYVKGLIYVNKKCLIESALLKGNLLSDIECNGGDFIDFRNGIAKTFEYRENTAYNSALNRDFFRMDAGGSTNFPGISSRITIEQNTFYNVSQSNRILYIRLAAHDIYFNKNILANTNGYYTNQNATHITAMSNNNYFNAPNFTGSTQSNAQNDTGNFTTLDPGFQDPVNGNFSVSNDDLKFGRVGDPRWLE